mmetsp:Transcript_92025/g.173453  ORF Transcript_92025/g.173453 Transcript_92025/m.173453 type:complete len:775 (-) Transcript_92025:230-2554(-)
MPTRLEPRKPNRAPLPQAKLLASRAHANRRFVKRRGCIVRLWCWLQRQTGKLPSIGQILKAARQSRVVIKKVCVVSVKQGAAFFFCKIPSILLAIDKWKALDGLWDMSTVLLSFIDIVCDVGVLFQFHARGYYGLFKAGCSIFAIAQVTYAFMFVVMYPPSCGTDLGRLKLFFKILPVAQLVPFFIWLQTFDHPVINRYLSWINAKVPEFEMPSEDCNKALQYIQMKARKHGGFIAEAFSEAIPQCLLQTAAICMYPELASPLSIYSILSSVSVIASKGYLFSFSANVPTRAFNFLCITADLLNVFATTTWIFADNSLADAWDHSFLLRCFGRSAYHGCLGFVAAILANDLGQLRSNRQAKGCITAFDGWTFFFSCVQTQLLLFPGVVLLAMLKLSLIPIVCLQTLSALDGESKNYFCFQEKIAKLLDPALPKALRERRICMVNVFALFAKLRIREEASAAGNSLDESGCGSAASMPDICLKDVGEYMYQRTAYTFNSPDAEMLPVLGLIEPAATGVLALRSAHQRQRETCNEEFDTDEEEDDILPPNVPPAKHARQESDREAVSRVQLFLSHATPLLKDALEWGKTRWNDTSEGDCVHKFLYICQFLLLVYSLPHLVFFAGNASLFVGQGMLYPVFRLGLLLWHAGEHSIDGLHSIQPLQMVLSVGFSFCVGMLVVLLPWVKKHVDDFSDVIFCHHPSWFDPSFFCPATADAMEKACSANNRRLEMVKTLHQKGLSSGLLAQVMTYVGPVKDVRRMPKVAKNSKLQKSKRGRR